MTPASMAEAKRARTRVFVGLRIAPEIATELAQLAAPLKQPKVRLVQPADIHLTLVPPWPEASLSDIIDKLGRVVPSFAAFRLIFEHVGYGPDPNQPRLLWVDCDCAADDEIASLRDALFEACGRTDERPFQPHVTLARIGADGAAIARKHPIDRPLFLTQWIESVELFEPASPGGTGYRVLASLPLAKAVGAMLKP